MIKKLGIIILSVLIVLNLFACSFNTTKEQFDELEEVVEDSFFELSTTNKYKLVKFGKQNEQDLVWYVVEDTDDYKILLSENILELMPYNNDMDVNYEDSSIYRYCKEEAVSKYFTETEKKRLLFMNDEILINIPTLNDLQKYFGEIVEAQSGYYGNESYFKANKEMISRPALSSDNQDLIDNAYDNYFYANHNKVEIDHRYNFATGCQPYWIQDNNDLYVNYVTSTGYVSRLMQNNKYVGFRPIIKIKKK